MFSKNTTPLTMSFATVIMVAAYLSPRVGASVITIHSGQNYNFSAMSSSERQEYIKNAMADLRVPQAPTPAPTEFELLSSKIGKLEETVLMMEKSVQALVHQRENNIDTVANITTHIPIKPQIQKMKISKPNFVEVNNGCGGVVNGNNGHINYTRLRSDDDMEECMWTILTDNTVLHFTVDSQSYSHTSITVLSVNRCNGSLEFIGKLQNNRTVSIASGVAILVFTSASKGKRFQLNYRSSGDPENGAVFAASHSMSSFGISHNQNLGPSEAAQYYHIFTQGSTHPNVIYDTDFLSGDGTFAKFPGVCDHESMTAYELVHHNRLRQLAQLPKVIGLNGSECASFTKVPNTPHWFKSTTGSFIVVYRTSTPDPKAMLSWTATIHDRSKSTSCGGSVYGNSGYIAYKRGEIYGNNEICNWYVYSTTNNPVIEFKLEEDGLESCCDKVEVEMQPNTYSAFGRESSKRSLSLEAVMATVRFRSDHSVNGTGFLLRYTTSEKEEDSDDRY